VADISELMESALHALAEGVALADDCGRVAFWNSSGEIITGWAWDDIVGRTVREILDTVLVGGRAHWIRQTDGRTGEHGRVVHIRHKLGVEIPVTAPMLVLRDGLGRRLGTGVLFHPVEKNRCTPEWGD
jgi:PAS domain S-box-containing protein